MLLFMLLCERRHLRDIKDDYRKHLRSVESVEQQLINVLCAVGWYF